MVACTSARAIRALAYDILSRRLPRHAADDAAQDITLATLRALERGTIDATALRAFITRRAQKRVVESRDRDRGRDALPRASLRDDLAETLASNEPAPDAVLERREQLRAMRDLHRAVRERIASAPSRYREVLEAAGAEQAAEENEEEKESARSLDDIAHREAEAHGKPYTETREDVDRRLSRARRWLRSAIWTCV
jgi:hypothetical protein